MKLTLHQEALLRLLYSNRPKGLSLDFLLRSGASPNTLRVLRRAKLINTYFDRGQHLFYSLTGAGEAEAQGLIKVVWLEIACNDPNNGSNLGRFDMAHVRAQGLDELIALEGRYITCSTVPAEGNPDRLRIGRIRVPIFSYATWVGNWCWDAARIRLRDALAALNYLQAAGWSAYEGESGLYDAFNSKQPLYIAHLLHGLAAWGAKTDHE